MGTSHFQAKGAEWAGITGYKQFPCQDRQDGEVSWRELIPRPFRGVNLKGTSKNGIVESPSKDYNEANFLPEASSSDG